jgi:hypothetical protein
VDEWNLRKPMAKIKEEKFRDDEMGSFEIRIPGLGV